MFQPWLSSFQNGISFFLNSKTVAEMLLTRPTSAFFFQICIQWEKISFCFWKIVNWSRYQFLGAKIGSDLGNMVLQNYIRQILIFTSFCRFSHLNILGTFKALSGPGAISSSFTDVRTCRPTPPPCSHVPSRPPSMNACPPAHPPVSETLWRTLLNQPRCAISCASAV